jgi:hypothetical protein
VPQTPAILIGTHMNDDHQNSGNRNVHRNAEPAARLSTASIWRLPLVRQIGGMALGVGIVIALSAASMWYKKQVGTDLAWTFSQYRTSLAAPTEHSSQNGPSSAPPIKTCATAPNAACQ